MVLRAWHPEQAPRKPILQGTQLWPRWIPVGETNFFSDGFFVKQRFASEQAALFVQGSYKFDVPCCGWPVR